MNKRLKIIAIIQARMGSSRLPEKVLKKILGKPLLLLQFERLKRAKTLDNIVIATTVSSIDDQIVKFCDKEKVPYFRGSEENVLERYQEAAHHYGADVIVRITADCPLIDPVILDKVVNEFLTHYPKFDYVSNTLIRTYPRGLDTEVFTIKALDEAYRCAATQEENEHVTSYIYSKPDKFNLHNVFNNSTIPQYRWCVDTHDDFILVKKIYENLYPKNPQFTFKDVLSLLKENPEWEMINSHVKQRDPI